LYLNILLISEF